jgi:scavenger receptor class B, member 1
MGWFVERNGSELYDGNFTINTGENDISKLGVVQLWKSQNKTHLYRDTCDNVKGTTGELWPPLADGEKPPLTLFATDFCRSVTLDYDSEYSKFGINGYKWVGGPSVFDNGEKYPEMACYCSADEELCPDLLYGVFNASSCKFGAPAFVSYPHFYLAHENYTNNIEGMNPDKDLHEFSISMEPRTGIPLNIDAKLQINLLMKSYDWTPMNNVPEIMVPMFWFRQTASLTPELADQAKIAVMLPDIGMYIAIGIAIVGFVIVIVGLYCLLYRWKRVLSDDEELLTG